MNIDDLMKEADQYGRSAWSNLKSGAGQAWDATSKAAESGLNQAKSWFSRATAGGPGSATWADAMGREGMGYGSKGPFAASGPRPLGPGNAGWAQNFVNQGTNYADAAAKANPSWASRAQGWINQPAGPAVSRGASALGRGAAGAWQTAKPWVGGAMGGASAVGIGELAAQGVVRGAEAAGLAEKGMTEDFNKSGTWFPAIQGSMRALAYAAGRGLNKVNSDWGITDDDVKYATRHGINIFDDSSGPKAREAQAKRHEALMKEIQQQRDQGAPERGAVVGTAPEVKGQLVVPKDENGEATGAPYFSQPLIAPRLRDATAQEAASLPIGNKTRQTLDFGRLGSATFAYDPEREARIKESMKYGLYDQTPRIVAANPDGKGGFTPGKYAMNPTDPARAAQGAADVESVRRGIAAIQDLRAAKLAQERGGVQAPPQADPAAMKALRAAMAQGQAPSKAAEPKAEKQPDMFNVLKQMVGDEKLAGRIMTDAAAAGLQPKNLRDLAIMTQAWQQRGDIMPPDAAPHANRFDYQVAAGEAPGWFGNGGLTVASRRSGRPVEISAGDMPPDTYYELLKRAGIEP